MCQSITRGVKISITVRSQFTPLRGETHKFGARLAGAGALGLAHGLASPHSGTPSALWSLRYGVITLRYRSVYKLYLTFSVGVALAARSAKSILKPYDLLVKFLAQRGARQHNAPPHTHPRHPRPIRPALHPRPALSAQCYLTYCAVAS